MPATRRCVHAKLASPPCSRGSTRRTRRRRRRRGLVTSLKPGSVAASPAEEAPHASSRRLRRGPAAVGSAGRAEEAGAQPRGDGEVGRRGARIAHVTQLRSNVDTESGCSAARTAARYARKATRTVSTHGGTRAAGVARPASRDTARAGRRPPRPGKTTASAAPSKACATRSSARAASCGRRRCVRKPAVRMPGAQVQVGQRGRRGEREARQQGGADGVARGRQVVEALRNLAAGTSQQVPRSRYLAVGPPSTACRLSLLAATVAPSRRSGTQQLAVAITRQQPTRRGSSSSPCPSARHVRINAAPHGCATQVSRAYSERVPGVWASTSVRGLRPTQKSRSFAQTVWCALSRHLFRILPSSRVPRSWWV